MTYVTGHEIPRTSVSNREGGPPVTVEFFKWTDFGGVGYQKGQKAGFSEEHATLIVKRGLGRIVGRID